MDWNLEGQRVLGKYLAQYPVSGQVEQSRVAFGGRVHHTVVLDQPINLFGTDRDRVIIEHPEILEVL